MSYRNKPRDSSLLCVVPSLSEIHILNGATSEFAFPCLYAIPDEAQSSRPCDPVTISELEEIKLREEGYADPVVAFEAPPAGLTAQAWIDADDEHIIRLVISAQCPTAVSENIKTKISMTITRQTLDRGPRTDSVFLGPVTVVAAPLPVQVP